MNNRQKIDNQILIQNNGQVGKMNKTGTILGFYHFDAFDLASCRKSIILLTIVSLMVFFSLMYSCVKYFSPWLIEMISFYKELPFISFRLASIGMIIESVLVMITATLISCCIFLTVFNIADFLHSNSLVKINADHKLKDFDLEKGSLKSIVKKDIKANGYFSAEGYWKLYFKNKNYVANTLAVNKRNAERKAIKSKYPNVF
jgi:hypothetical protein